MHGDSGADGEKPEYPPTLMDALVAEDRRANGARNRALRTAKRHRIYNIILLWAGVLLAAAATVTILPEGTSRVVGAGLALGAAIVNGLTAAFNPARKTQQYFLLAGKWARLQDDIAALARRLGTIPNEDAENELKTLLDGRDALRNEELDGGGAEADK